MRKKSAFVLFLFLLIAFSISGFSQPSEPAEMADTMRSNGKIYVVIAVILTILGGLILYLVRLDRKISRLEKSDH
jgi:amino acid transporter